MGDISTWSLIASQNGTLGSPPDYWPEGQAPSTVNDCAREMMRALKKQFLDASWVNAGDTPTYISASKFSVSSSTSTAQAYYAVGRRIRLNDATTLYGTVTEASVSATTTNITVALDSGSLAASLSAVAFSIFSSSNTPIPAITSSPVYAADAQASDTYVITPSPAISSYSTGLTLNFKANTVNTGAATLNVSGLGAKTIVKPYGQTLEDGDIAAGQIATVVYDGTNFVLQSQSQRVLYQNLQQIYAADAQANDSYAITLSPAITAYVTGQMFNFKANTANTGAATLNVNGLGAKTIKKNVSSDLSTGDILSGQIVTVIYDGTNFQMPPSATAASQSDQETGTSTTSYVSPGTQQYHQSAAKAWVVYTTITTTTNQASYNITSLTDNGTGDTTVTFATAFSSANYASCISGTRDDSTVQVVLVNINTVNTNRAAGSVIIRSTDSNFSTAADYYTVSAAFFGDQ